ncbi:RNA polymerase sigma factor [Streptococcus ovuberis]|uniref:RNA polymerase sigma factor n=1 Tax=Streptococcus ovuberis TaxID=1936207 RepID=A0A7X6S1J8_9STRE|nr:RNA polymerase sigma factor [Streptococcus ovuberis]NKZ21244.1 RNA polymerase sigma factor [Streptococcus ovuberis]
MKLDAYSEQLIRWAKEVVAYLVSSGVKPSDAEDVVQDVFIRLLEAEFILSGTKIRAWMYRTAVRRYIDLYRRDKKYHEILQKEFFRPEELLFYDTRDYDKLWEALQSLPQAQQLALELHYFQGFSIKEIAQVAGSSQSKIKMDLLRGRQTVKDLLEKEGDFYGSI